MISSDGMHQDNLIFFVVEITGLSPTEVRHLVDKGTLADNSADQFDREVTVVEVRAQDPVRLPVAPSCKCKYRKFGTTHLPSGSSLNIWYDVGHGEPHVLHDRFLPFRYGTLPNAH